MKHECYPDLSVQLQVDGVALAEYDVENDRDPADPNVVEKYVEAAEGAYFKIDFEAAYDMAPSIEDIIECSIYIDGGYLFNRLISDRASRVGNEPTCKRTFEGVETNVADGRTLERFSFAALRTSDDPVENTGDVDYKQLGEVAVECRWARKDGDASYDASTNPTEFNHAMKVSEKCLKGRAISSRAILGAPEILTGQTKFWDTTYPYGEDPFVDFVFKYRSRKDLQIEGIIPRSPSPEPAMPLEKRDPDDLSPEEARELIRRLGEREWSIGIKREKRERAEPVDLDGEDEVTVIASSSKRHRKFDTSTIDIIDLTDD